MMQSPGIDQGQEGRGVDDAHKGTRHGVEGW
jgi:hypothetical protein